MNHDDTPAAVPLIGLITGLALGSLLVNPHLALAGWLATAVATGVLHRLRTPSPSRGGFARRTTRFFLFAALGLALALHAEVRDAREGAAFNGFHPERFVNIVAPLERDWKTLDDTSAAGADDAFVLRASHFSANGIAFDAPISVYARFPPPPMAMEADLRAEGFLRISEHGGYTLSVKSPELLSYAGQLPRWHPAAWNRALAQRLDRHGAGKRDEVALAQALVLGRGEHLTEEMRDSFRAGGTYHLLVFSGLQIALAAGLLAALLRWMHAPRASDWLLLAFAALAPLFIGPSASVARASVGIGLYALSRICKRPTSIENLWCVAAIARLLVEPRDLTEASFHLTYAGAGALLFIGKHFQGKGLRRPLGALVAAETAITPLTLFHFHQYALGGSVVTLLMSPVIFAMLAVSLLACAYPWFLGAIGILHRLCILLNAGGLAGFFAAPPLEAMLTGGALALLALAFLRGRVRAVAITLALLVPSVAAIVRSRSQHNVEHPAVTFFDIGQGDAIALRSGTHTVLVDGGRGERILPMLVDRGIRSLDAVILSHAHPDHCEGLAPVLAHLQVRTLWLSPRQFRGACAAQLLAAASFSQTPIHLVRDGDTLQSGDLHFTALAPETRFRRSPENNSSIVLRVMAGGRRFLLTGDIEKEAELYLADQDLRADVLKVAHHGSRSSSSPSLLDGVAPRLAIISCGRHNLFGHPHASVLEALSDRHIRVWRTDTDGTIEIVVREGRLYVRPGLH
ncbi:MAG: DNA internalization-related competence protein ComEC/Rec2 [Acidobacteriota bacterium]